MRNELRICHLQRIRKDNLSCTSERRKSGMAQEPWAPYHFLQRSIFCTKDFAILWVIVAGSTRSLSQLGLQNNSLQADSNSRDTIAYLSILTLKYSYNSSMNVSIATSRNVPKQQRAYETYSAHKVNTTSSGILNCVIE